LSKFANPPKTLKKWLRVQVLAIQAKQVESDQTRIAAGPLGPERVKVRIAVRTQPSRHATAPHVHTQLTREGAERYRAARQSQASTGEAKPPTMARGEGKSPIPTTEKTRDTSRIPSFANAPSSVSGAIARDSRTYIGGKNQSSIAVNTPINISNVRGEVVPEAVAKAVQKEYQNATSRASDLASQPAYPEAPAAKMLGGADPWGGGGSGGGV
jgi:hypothetical protein